MKELASLAIMRLAKYFFGLLVTRVAIVGAKSPHIVVLVADDMGWNDVSWHNSKVFKTLAPSMHK